MLPLGHRAPVNKRESAKLTGGGTPPSLSLGAHNGRKRKETCCSAKGRGR